MLLYLRRKILKERRLMPMLKVEVNSGENIERALKRYKNKFNKTGVRRELQNRKQFTKPSVEKRAQLQKAEYVQHLKDAKQF